jgi:hypothetical protein
MSILRTRHGLRAALVAHIIVDIAIFGAAASQAIYRPG